MMPEHNTNGRNFVPGHEEAHLLETGMRNHRNLAATAWFAFDPILGIIFEGDHLDIGICRWSMTHSNT